MKIIVEDLSNKISLETPNLDIKHIDIGHTLSIKCLDKSNNIKKIEGFVQNIKHEIGVNCYESAYIQIYK